MKNNDNNALTYLQSRKSGIATKKKFVTDYGTFNMYHRKDTADYRLCRGVCSVGKNSGEYFRMFDENVLEMLSKRHVWLDLGAHIGAFSIRVSTQFECVVWAYEAYYPNFTFLVSNVRMNGFMDIHMFNEVVVPGVGEGIVKFYTAPISSGSGTLLKLRGRSCVDVVSIGFDTLIGHTGAECVKMDIEGAEYDILMNSKKLDRIRLLLLEYHAGKLRDSYSLEKYHNILELLKSKFDYVTDNVITGTPRNFCMIAYK